MFSTQKQLLVVLSKFDRCFDSPPLTREQFLELYRAKTLVCEVSEIVMDCRDPKDNKFLALALAAQADVLVTGDGRRETGDGRDLLKMHPYRGVSIFSARDFLG